jgi:hypothetical protein
VSDTEWVAQGCQSSLANNDGAYRARVDINKYGVKGTDDFCTFEKKSILDILHIADGIISTPLWWKMQSGYKQAK